MGLFTIDDCPTCGRELSVTTDGFEDFYVCWPCRRTKLKAENRIKELERRLDKLEAKEN